MRKIISLFLVAVIAFGFAANLQEAKAEAAAFSEAPMLAEKVASEEKELITIFYGEDIDEKSAQKAQSIFEKANPDAEIALIKGDQPVYYYLISAE